MGNQYTIHDVAALLGISTDAIRLYEKEGLVEPLRNPNNGYRYYEVQQIHRIMGISLYRQLDASIAEIKQLLQHEAFPGVSQNFSDFIESNEQEIERLQRKNEKLRFMKQHIDTLGTGINHYSIQTLPPCYSLYNEESGQLIFHDLKEIIPSPIFSFGNFCYTLHADANQVYHTSSLRFLIREPMMEICPWKEEYGSLQKQPACRCLYTVCFSPETKGIRWELDGLLAYAKEQGYKCASYAYAFYVYSLMQKQAIIDYYEIYLPILEIF